MASESTVNSPSVSSRSDLGSGGPQIEGPSLPELEEPREGKRGEKASLEPIPSSRTRGNAKGVAIVDDEEDLCSLFSLLIKSLGYRIDYVAHDGNEIVRAILEKRIRPDLILMDYRMPVMNGIQAAEKIRLVLPDVKIVVESADDTIKKEAISSGLYFIQKPFSMPMLAQILKKALEKNEDNSSQSH